MRFESRELKPFSEPVCAEDLVAFETYFAVQFLDAQMLVPTVEPLIYLGVNLLREDRGVRYFQDAESFRAGVRFGLPNAKEGRFSAQPDDQLKHVFTFSKALEVLMSCELRRNASGQPA